MNFEIGDQGMLRRYLDSQGFNYLLPEIENYIDRFPNWAGIVSGGGRVMAVTPFSDDSADRPDGNRRVKPSSELCPFAADEEAGFELLRKLEDRFPVATRYCGIRAPVDEIPGIGRWERILADLGYRPEACMPRLFTLGGREYDVVDYGKNAGGRLSEFPEHGRLVTRVMREVFWNSRVRALTDEELAESSGRLLGIYDIGRAGAEDSQGLVNLLRNIFPVYGTYNLEATMPAMVADSRPSAPLVYVARRRSDREVIGTCTIERYPFCYGELTDVAVHETEAGNGLGTAMCYLALSEARDVYRLAHYWSDDVPDPAMNKIAKRLGAVFSGVHDNQVRLSTRGLMNEIGRIPDSTSLIVCTGSTRFQKEGV